MPSRGAASGRPTRATGAIFVVVVVGILTTLATWAVLYAVNLATITPIVAASDWAHSFGLAGDLVFLVGPIVTIYTAKWFVDRRDQRRQYAVDHTIHVARPKPWWFWVYCGVLAAMMLVAISGSFLEAPLSASRSAVPPAPSSR